MFKVFIEAALLATTGSLCFRAWQLVPAAWEVVAVPKLVFTSILLRKGDAGV